MKKQTTELGKLVSETREKLGISQRELAKLTGISRSTLNDLINGKIKKVDIDDLRKIVETLEKDGATFEKISSFEYKFDYVTDSDMIEPDEAIFSIQEE